MQNQSIVITDTQGRPVSIESISQNSIVTPNSISTTTVTTKDSSSKSATSAAKVTAALKQPRTLTSIMSPRRGSSKSVKFAVEDNGKSTKQLSSSKTLHKDSFLAECMFLVLDYLMVVVPLASLHVVLDVLVYKQYGQDIVFREMASRGITSLFVLIVVHSVFHPSHSKVPFQMLLLLGGMMLGMYLVHIAQTQDYFAVMKQAPPVGTLLAWTVVELEYYWSAVGMAVVGFWYWLVKV